MKFSAYTFSLFVFFGLSTSLSLPLYAGVAFDYDGDEKADLAVRRNSNSLQYISNSSDFDIERIAFGRQPGDVPVSGDFDGDGIYDIAIRRPANQTWYIVNSSGTDALTNNEDGISRIRFGRHMADVPVPADYDGDGKTDIAVRRPSTQYWYIRNSSGVDAISGNSDGITRFRFGLQAADIPVPADYDGDGKTDLAVRRPSEQRWFIRNSTGEDALTGHADGISRVLFGRRSTDIPVVADYDGDGKTDIAVRRPATHQWYIQNSSGIDATTGHADGISRVIFGRDSHDIPVIADYDGDGKADIAVRRPATHTWYIHNSAGRDLRTGNSDGITRARFGLQAQDIPLAQPPHLIWLISDIDNDGLSNQQEMALDTDITNADSDNDGLTDGKEVNEHQTDPLNSDSDGDGRNDGDEITAGTDPNSAENTGPFNFSEASLTGLKAYRLQGAPHTDGQLQHAWSVWHFTQNDYAILHRAENSSQLHYRYEIINDNQLLLRPVNELYTDTINCFEVSRSSWWETRLEVFGDGVFDAISDACWLDLFPNDSLSLSYGEVESRWELQQSNTQTFTVSGTNVRHSILELPEAVLEFWPDDVSTSIETQTPIAPYELVYVSENIMPELLDSGLEGSWIMPLHFSAAPSEENKYLGYGFLHDHIVIAAQEANSLLSKVIYEVTVSNTGFSLEQDNQKLVYTPVNQLSDNFLVLVEHYLDNVLYDVHVSMMVKTKPLDGSFLSAPTTTLPQAYAAFLQPNSIYDAQIPLSDLQAYHLNQDNQVKIISHDGDGDGDDNVFTVDTRNTWQVNNDREIIMQSPYSNGVISRHWEVADVTESGQAIVLEYQVNARGYFNEGEFTATSQRFIEQPRLNVVSKIDLSEYGDVWNNTDFDRDGLNNQIEAELGTDIENSDTDGDGFTDYEEWISHSDPTDSQSTPTLLRDLDIEDESLRNCLYSDNSPDDILVKVQSIICGDRGGTSPLIHKSDQIRLKFIQA